MTIATTDFVFGILGILLFALVLKLVPSSGFIPFSVSPWENIQSLALGTRVAYLWCANGIGISRLWTMANRAIGDAGTARNMATMTRLLATLDK